MKKRGLTWALIGTILGIIVLIALIYLTVRLLPSFSKDCTNKVYWENIKSELKFIEDGKTSTIFFKNGNCYLVSFSPSLKNEINPPQGITAQNTALCLCKLSGTDCIVQDVSKQCYFFSQITGFNLAEQFNTGKGSLENKDYLFIKFEKQGSNLLITTK